MRKICVCALGTLFLFSIAGVGCAGRQERASYKIEGEYFEAERKLVAQMTVTVPNKTENALTELPFELWANAYREGAQYRPVSELYAPAAYYAGESYGGIEITGVEGAAGYAVGGEDENILTVSLKEPLYPNETATVAISFEVTLANVNHRLGVGEHNVNLTHFYPVLCAYGERGFLEYVYPESGDPFVSESADYSVSLTFPEEYLATFNGTGEISAAGGKKTLRMTAENVRDVSVVLGKGLKMLTDDGSGVTVEYWYLSDGAPRETLKAARDSLTYFSHSFSDYAYPRYVLVETDFPYGGMEYSGMAAISCGLKREEVPAVVAHETAHQWWYAMVGSNQFEHAWQDEGLAEYSVAMFLGAYPEYGTSYRETVARSESGYRAFFSVQSQVTKEADTTMDRPLTSFSGDYEYRNIVYDKGVILFDRVRSAVGERKFSSALREYAEEYAGKIAAPEELIACFHRHGANAEDLFRSFTEGRCVI